VPALYNRPQSVDDIIEHSVGRVLDLFGIDNTLVKRWGEPEDDARDPAPVRKA
jgi:4-hydroxy-3-polyprenylbenzoate decarboxylase